MGFPQGRQEGQGQGHVRMEARVGATQGHEPRTRCLRKLEEAEEWLPAPRSPQSLQKEPAPPAPSCQADP